MMEQTTLSKWAEFNRRRWNCRSDYHRLQLPQSEVYGEMLLFMDAKGRSYLPPQNPYHLTYFYPTATSKASRSNKQWHEVANLMIDRLLELKGRVILHLPPHIEDVRPFTWRGFKSDVRYTYQVELPYQIEEASKSIRNKIKKASSLGYYTVKSNNMDHAYQCLIETEQRQGFSHQLSVEDLKLAQDLMGEEAFRCYICYSPEGEPVSTNISLLFHPEWATGWIAGTKSAHLQNGVVQMLQLFEFEDLTSIGVKGFDFTGANIESVSNSKASWGGDLVPYYVLRRPSFKDIARAGIDWLQFNSKQSRGKR
ncbi:Acetyltransferase (GNAT) domain-containing protein [Paenibacillus barengoltzii J12]|jgi:hypothetical protein|uniref:Uncharacterized protein n=3 Tax=Paenibacillus barengoltzii TaxID=343517 RepID=R9L7I4_9BACL|nr:hypothetical protein C812_03581 [Paenibacillus barengoltzii G22]SMF33216.1 Acetyltransferase (GNAT) domain-containing protein [Paenibacillus barengoltzii J12]